MGILIKACSALWCVIASILCLRRGEKDDTASSDTTTSPESPATKTSFAPATHATDESPPTATDQLADGCDGTQNPLSAATCSNSMHGSSMHVEAALEADEDVQQLLSELDLYISAKTGDTSILLELLRLDALHCISNINSLFVYKAPNWISEAQTTALCIASALGHHEFVELLLLHPYIDVNACDDQFGWTALHLAADQHAELVVSALLQSLPLEVNKKTKSEETALFLACENGSSAIVQLLLADGRIDVNAPRKTWTPLHTAVDKGHEEVMQLLINHPKVNVNAQNECDDTPLHLAAFGGHTGMVTLLLRHPHIQVNHRNHDDDAAYDVVCRGYFVSQANRSAIEVALIARGASPKAAVSLASAHSPVQKGHSAPLAKGKSNQKIPASPIKTQK